MDTDIERMMIPTNEFSDKHVRQGFIRKVYALLTFTLLITFGFIMLFRFHSGLNVWCRQHPYVPLILMIAAIFPMCAVVCSKNIGRRVPANYLILFLFVTLFGVGIGMGVSVVHADFILMAVGITGITVIGLTLFAMQTKIDFTLYSGLAFCLLIVLMVMGFLVIFFRAKWAQILIGGLGAGIFSFYIVIDTQLIMGGRSDEISAEDYVFAVIMLYIDIVNLFMKVLQIISASNSN